MQLSLIPDIVSAEPTAKVQSNARQLSLNILGSIATVPADTKPKQVLSNSQAWYQGRLCKVVKRYSESFDGLTLKLCTIKLESGDLLDVPQDHITIL
jgi:hypothetical protein